MNVILANGKIGEIEIRPSKYPIRSELSCRSKIQYAVGQYLINRFKFDPILEDVPTPEGFYFDFFLPKRKIAIEIQGEQHDTFIPFFHKTRRGFAESKLRDNAKKEFCNRNDITLICVKNINELKELWNDK